MEILLIIERFKSAVIDGARVSGPGHITNHDVEHQVLSFAWSTSFSRKHGRLTYHPTIVQGRGQGLKLLGSAEVGVDGIQVIGPIAMVCYELLTC